MRNRKWKLYFVNLSFHNTHFYIHYISMLDYFVNMQNLFCHFALPHPLPLIKPPPPNYWVLYSTHSNPHIHSCGNVFPYPPPPPPYPVAVFKFWGPGPFFIWGTLRVNVENSWGLGALKISRFWSNSGHFGAIWNNFGTYLTGCFWRYGWVFFWFWSN